MSIVTSVTLRALADTTPSCKSTPKLALLNLVESANGPVRLKRKFENGNVVPYLGIRGWRTYFFEKLFATDKQKADARRETMVAIEKYVRPFLNEHGVAAASKSTPEETTARLYSMVTRQPVMERNVSASMPYFQSGRNFTKIEGKLFHGIARVPDRISVGVGDPSRIIADVHLVRQARPESYLMGNLKKGRIVEQNKFHKLDQLSDSEFEQKYLSMLENEKGAIQTSVVLELQLDAGGQCSNANLEGAKRAAEKFLSTQNNARKNISIMLIVPSLPSSVGSAGNIAKTVDPDGETSVKNLDQQIMVSENSQADSSSDEDSH